MNQMNIRKQVIEWSHGWRWAFTECYIPQAIQATTEQANRRLGDVKQTLSPKRPRIFLGVVNIIKL